MHSDEHVITPNERTLIPSNVLKQQNIQGSSLAGNETIVTQESG